MRLQLPEIGMRWPQTCNLCGAPLMNRRCPRCGYERAKEGEAVYSGIAGGVVATERVIALGTVKDETATLDTITIPNVTLVNGNMLVVYAGITGDTSETVRSTASWGGNGLVAGQDLYNADSTLYGNILSLDITPALAGTHDLLVFNNDPRREVSFALAGYMTDKSFYRQTWHNQSGSPVISASLTIAADFDDGYIFNLWTKNAVADPGPWVGPATQIQGLAIGGVFAPGFISQAGGPTGIRTFTVTKTQTPAAAFLLVGDEFGSSI